MLDRTVLARALIAVGLLLGIIVLIGSLVSGFVYGIIMGVFLLAGSIIGLLVTRQS